MDPVVRSQQRFESAETAAPAAADTDDLALVRAARDGDAAAQRRLFERMRRASRVIPARNARLGVPLAADEIEDLVQETLVALWRKLDVFDGRVRIETWTAGFALYELMRRLRSNRRFAELLARSALSHDAHVEPTLDFDQVERVQQALDTLDPAEARIVRLRYFDEQSFDAIARDVGEAASTVKTRCYRALDRLRVRLRGTAGELEDGQRGGR